MSQITRCPSCATTFKVVADQLRISEGWVRCGQCKEVFDASAHLLPVPPPVRSPDASLTSVRAPVSSMASMPEAVLSEGKGLSSASAAEGLVAQGAWARTADTMGLAGAAATPLDTPTSTAAAPVLHVPSPAVPGFLTIGASTAVRAGAAVGEVAAPFLLRAPVHDIQTADPEPLVVHPDPAADSALTPQQRFAPHITPPAGLSQGQAATTPPAVVSGGYELPCAVCPDGEGLLDTTASDPHEAPAVAMLESRSASLADAQALSPDHGQPGPPTAATSPAAQTPGGINAVAHDGLAVAAAMDPPPDGAVAAAMQQASASPLVAGELALESSEEAAPELSFVVAARRKAFWRQPAVRALLGLVWVVALLMLALQVAVQERHRIAALDPRTRPWLEQLCAPLRCELAPLRQIADVVIESSSFNKARGDSYQLTLTMKNNATIPLAMPAVELTLTDAQDQPVVRRVLLPADLGAPSQLTARGDWSISASVIVTTGGARVAGYRLLAFYP